MQGKTAGPLVSVVLAVRDGMRWLPESVESVLAQSHRELELVAVDDGSADGSGDWLAAQRDPRVVVLRNERPLGLAASLNRGIEQARGEFVARMDADDVAHPDRLRVQAAYLRAHADVGLVGARIETIGPAGESLASAFDPPAGEALVAWRLLLFTNPICHASAMFRRGVALDAGGYDESLPTSQDRDLWGRMLLAARVVNLPERLLRLRVHPDSVSATRTDEQRANSLAIRRRLLARFLGGDDPGRPIEHWYDDRLEESDLRDLRVLFLDTYDALVHRLDPPPEELRAIRRDLADRLDSLRRRDGRVPPESAARVLASRLVPERLRSRLARWRGAPEESPEG